MGRNAVSDMEGFELGTPALVCRWRLSARRLPLENRHLRALLARTVNGQPVTTELVAWAKQHIEWTLDKGAIDHPNGTLMLIIDTQGRAAMTVGPYTPLEDSSLAGLLRRAASAQAEARTTGVRPETLWVSRDDTLLWDPGVLGAPSGAASLVVHLATTLGIDVREQEGLCEAVARKALAYDEAFLVSDEHGVVPARDAAGTHGTRLSEGYGLLLARM